MHTNRLIKEKSPYLLQHAHNPVDWHAWGEEAFTKARSEDKPIFLSVGYSTCHWCHVMERESFESEEVAAVLNRHFVPVKVDREERPDVDRIYMLFVQAATGGGGWPLSVWLTPDLKPFFGGTYFPPDNRYGRPGFKAVLERLAGAWSADRDRIVATADEALEQLKRHTEVSGGAEVDMQAVESCFARYRRIFDTKFGGFGSAPKFPRPVVHNFLLRYHAATGNEEALQMVVETLHAMARGGICDQLGGGFHRYSVDERWYVPHFEKMLYDQAQLTISYLEAYELTRDEKLAGVARDICEYVLRDLRHPEGGFYSAEDADSAADPARPEEKEEGAYYVWTPEQLEQVLGRETAARFRAAYGDNILSQTGAAEGLEDARQALLAERAKRVRPHLDDKILTAWNGLMISAFARGAQVLKESRYLDAARRAADFILTHMRGERLLRRFRQGESAIPGFLDDYAGFTVGLLDLYEASPEARYIEAAAELAEQMIALFEDRERGGFFSTAAGDDSLVLRIKDDYDGAEPAGNSMAVTALLRLARMTDRADFRAPADRALRAFGPHLTESPETLPQMLAAWLAASRAQPGGCEGFACRI